MTFSPNKRKPSINGCRGILESTNGSKACEKLNTEIQETWLDVQVTRVSVNKQTQSFCKEIKMKIKRTWIHIQKMKMLVDATWWELKMQMAKVKARAGCGRCGNISAKIDRLTSPDVLPVRGCATAQQLDRLRERQTPTSHPAGAGCWCPA
jgi:hypothetical protein